MNEQKGKFAVLCTHQTSVMNRMTLRMLLQNGQGKGGGGEPPPYQHSPTKDSGN